LKGGASYRWPWINDPLRDKPGSWDLWQQHAGGAPPELIDDGDDSDRLMRDEVLRELEPAS